MYMTFRISKPQMKRLHYSLKKLKGASHKKNNKQLQEVKIKHKPVVLHFQIKNKNSTSIHINSKEKILNYRLFYLIYG